MSNVMFRLYRISIETLKSKETVRWAILGELPELILENASYVTKCPSAGLTQTFYLYSVPEKYITMLDMLEADWRNRLPEEFEFVDDDSYESMTAWNEFLIEEGRITKDYV